MKTLYLDVATTGMDLTNDRVVEIGITEVIDGELSGRVFHRYLYPGNLSIDSGVAEVNGYDLDFLVGKPSFSTIAGELLAFVESAEIVSLETAFDIGFLNAELNRINMQSIETFCHIVTDLRSMTRKLVPKERTLMRNLLEKYHIEVTNCPALPAKLQSTALLYRLHSAMIKASPDYQVIAAAD
jgi:DNA polymerase-3 subunit epsilon